MGWLRNVLTEDDNSTYDLVRLLAFGGALEGLGLVAYTVIWKGAAFDLQQFGIGFGVLLTALGAALKLQQQPPVQK